MKRTIVEISIGTEIGGELRQATAEVEVPEGTSLEAAAGLAAAFSTGYAKLWAVAADTVHATVALVRTDREVLHYGDVRAIVGREGTLERRTLEKR